MIDLAAKVGRWRRAARVAALVAFGVGLGLTLLDVAAGAAAVLLLAGFALAFSLLDTRPTNAFTSWGRATIRLEPVDERPPPPADRRPR